MKRATLLILSSMLALALLPSAAIASDETNAYQQDGSGSYTAPAEEPLADTAPQEVVDTQATPAENPAADTSSDQAAPAYENSPAVDTELVAQGGSDASAYFHTTITVNRDTYVSGETAQASIRYTLDQGVVSPGDYVIVTIPADIASSATFSASRQHFSSVEDLGGGQYKLTFGDDAETGLSGSMTVRITTNADTETTDSITAGDGAKAITVVPGGGGESGTGTYADEAIMKDGLGNEGMSYGWYDYSQDVPAQVGLFDSTVDQDFTYRLFVNRKNVAMTDVTVTDTLPDGMYFNGVDTVVCRKMDPATMSATDEVLADAVVTLSGQTLTVNLGDIDYPVQIEYSVHVPAQNSVQLRNHSEVVYTQDGTTYKEQRDYIAQGYDYSASNGVKSVDKTVISNKASDQWVTYTIRFWNDQPFAAGEIRLVDKLDAMVRFLYSDDNEYFELTVDENDPSVLYITNVKDIPTSTEVFETFVCDFSGVSVGHSVTNTVGGNITVTKKISASAQITARKTVDGAAPASGESFQFKLMDENHRVIQTAASDEGGNVAFAKIEYDTSDLGKTYTYYLAEVVPADDTAYTYDETEYTVTVTIGDEAGEDGVVPVSVDLSKDGEPVDEALFDNQKQESDEPGDEPTDEPGDEPGDEPSPPEVTPSDDGNKPNTPQQQTVAAPSATPKTGDDNQMGLLFLLAGGCLLTLAAAVRVRALRK